jgi:hypothetical protein
LGERVVRNDEVSGSIPLSSTTFFILAADFLFGRLLKQAIGSDPAQRHQISF